VKKHLDERIIGNTGKDFYVIKQEEMHRYDTTSTQREMTYYNNPIGSNDDRMLVWEFKRPQIDIQNFNEITVNGLKFDLANLPTWRAEFENENIMDESDDVKNLRRAISKLDEKDAIVALNLLILGNEAVVQIEPLSSGLLACNTNALFLGSMEECKAALFYIIKYISKYCTALESSLSVIKYAMDKKAAHPSIAKDTGTDSRHGQQLLQIILNKLVGLRQVSDTQAAAI
jgi:hypothetical protein